MKVEPNDSIGEVMRTIPASTIIILVTIIGTGYVANYRLGEIEKYFSGHLTTGHTPTQFELVKMASEYKYMSGEMGRLRNRVRALEGDVTIPAVVIKER